MWRSKSSLPSCPLREDKSPLREQRGTHRAQTTAERGENLLYYHTNTTKLKIHLFDFKKVNSGFLDK